MATEYKAVFGFGVVLSNVEAIEEAILEGEKVADTEYESLEEFFDDVEGQSMAFDGFSVKEFRSWDGCETYMMTIDNAFKDGYSGVKQRVRELYQYLESWGLETEQEQAEVVGGLDVC